jgi:hypothetical protein
MRDTLWLPCPQMTTHTLGSTITYLRRFSAMSVVGISPTDEDDGNAAAEAHKPGAPGSASGGTDFRPAGPRRMAPGQSSANGRRMANDDEHLLADRAKGTTGKPPASNADLIAAKSKAFVDKAINTLRLTGQSVDSLKRYLDDNKVEIDYLEAKAPDQHDRFFEVYNEVAATAAARVS